MRKKICSKCGKIIAEGTQCSCKNTTFTKNNKKKEKDPIHSTQWRKKRLQIIKRDKLCMRCFIKYKVINGENLTVHHILSRKNYPELIFDDSNLVCLCETCNKQLGTKDKLDFEWKPDEFYGEVNDFKL